MNLRPLPPESVVRSESHLYSTRYAHRPCANVTGVNDKNGQDVPGVSHDLVTPCPRSGHGRRWGFGRGFLSSGDDSQIKQVEKRTKKGTITGMGPGTKLEVFFYRTESGNEPVRDWLKGLDKQDRRTLGGDIRTVQFGWPLGMPVVRKLDHGLWEIRSRLDKRIARVIFAVQDGRLVLLHGFIKKSQKTPREDLDLARVRQVSLEN